MYSVVIELFDIIMRIDLSNWDGWDYLFEYYLCSIDKRIRKQVNVASATIYFYEDESVFDVEKISAKLGYFALKDEVVYFDKSKSIIVKNRMIKRENARNFLDIKWDKREKQNTNGNIKKENEKKIEISVGRFSPILEIEKIDAIDRCQVPVYRAVINKEMDIFLATQGGKGITDNRAYNSAIGECIERFACKLQDLDICKIASYEELKKSENVISPKELSSHFVNVEMNEFDCDKDYRWIKAINLKNLRKYYIEASFVFFPYKDLRGQSLSKVQSTTGVACAGSISEATFRALLEVIERNAYSITHKTKRKSHIIDCNGLNDTNKGLLKLLKDKGIFCHLLLLEEKGRVYIVHCTTESKDKKYPIYTHGSGADLEINTAVTKAILECLQLRISQLELKNSCEYNKQENIAYRKWAEGDKGYCNMFLQEYNMDEIKVDPLKCTDNSTGNISQDICQIIDGMEDEYVLAVDLSLNYCDLKVVRVIAPSYQDIDSRNIRITERLKRELGQQPLNQAEIFS